MMSLADLYLFLRVRRAPPSLERLKLRPAERMRKWTQIKPECFFWNILITNLFQNQFLLSFILNILTCVEDIELSPWLTGRHYQIPRENLGRMPFLLTPLTILGFETTTHCTQIVYSSWITNVSTTFWYWDLMRPTRASGQTQMIWICWGVVFPCLLSGWKVLEMIGSALVCEKVSTTLTYYRVTLASSLSFLLHLIVFCSVPSLKRFCNVQTWTSHALTSCGQHVNIGFRSTIGTLTSNYLPKVLPSGGSGPSQVSWWCWHLCNSSLLLCNSHKSDFLIKYLLEPEGPTMVNC